MSNPTKSDMPIPLVMSPGSLEVKVRLKGQGHGKKNDNLKGKSEVIMIVCLQLRMKTVNIIAFITLQLVHFCCLDIAKREWYTGSPISTVNRKFNTKYLPFNRHRFPLRFLLGVYSSRRCPDTDHIQMYNGDHFCGRCNSVCYSVHHSCI